MIVQELHKIQHRHGYLPKDELERLSREIEQPLYRLHEVASFFPHYRLEPPPAVEVRVCRDMACHLRGAAQLTRNLQQFASEQAPGRVHCSGVSCLGQCDYAPALTITTTISEEAPGPATSADHNLAGHGHGHVQEKVYRNLPEADVLAIVESALNGQPLRKQPAPCTPSGWKIDPYDGQPRYDALRKLVEAWQADRGPAEGRRKRLSDPLLKILETATLRGMGGASFPTHRKWSTVRDAVADVKYVVVNGDESEPGTFKDRELLRRAPHLLVEGIVIAGIVTGAERGYIYIRHEYEQEIEVMRQAIVEAARKGACGERIFGSDLSFPVEVYVSPGGYICGEESALLEAMEDRRAEPRNKPPLPVYEGYKGKPTVVNNVETLSWVPAILIHGGEWYRDQGVRGATGLRFVSISGDVNKPGVYEVPFGQTVRELIFESSGGMRGNKKLKAIATSGPSGGFLPAMVKAQDMPPKFIEGLVKRKLMAPDAATFDMLDLPLDSNVLTPFPDLMLGAAFVVYAEGCDMVDQALNCLRFYRNESCGKCVPCRLGTQKMVNMLEAVVDGRFQEDVALFDELADAMFQASICGLGHVAANPIRTVMRYFPAELNRYLAQRP